MKRFFPFFAAVVFIFTFIPSAGAADKYTPQWAKAKMCEARGIIPSGYAFSKGVIFRNDYDVPCFYGTWENGSDALHIYTADNFITAYYYNETRDRNPDSEQLKNVKNKLDENKRKKIAAEAVKKFNPSLLGDFTLVKNENSPEEYTEYYFFRSVNGIRLDENTGVVDVGCGGKILKYLLSSSFVNIPDSEFPAPDKCVDKYNAGYKYFKENDGRYTELIYEYKGEKNVYPFYNSPYYASYAELDAMTGARSDYGFGESYYYTEYKEDVPDDDYYFDDCDYCDYDDDCDEDDSEYYFSPINRSCLKEGMKCKKKYISEKNLIRRIKKDINLTLPKGTELKEESRAAGKMSRVSDKEQDIIYCVFSDKNDVRFRLEICADAYTGEIFSFSRSYEDRQNFSAEEYNKKGSLLKKTAEKYMKHYLGDSAREYKIESVKDGCVEMLRYVNDIPVYEYSAKIQFDSEGNVVKFDYDCSVPRTGLVFRTGNLITQEDAVKNAYSSFYTGIPPETCYKTRYGKDGNVSVSIIYIYRFGGFSIHVNALTGVQKDSVY